ncbi:MAG: hypothetical protein GX824_04875 [Clostridiales bacterium]|jgi:hypothetical protein|nr:hypothetical protein [Clostridiales bacterium]
MCKSLSELSEEYFEGVKMQDELIAKYREKLRQARLNASREEEIRISRLLKILYDQRNELIDTAYHLKNYYNCHEDADKAAYLCG